MPGTDDGRPDIDIRGDAVYVRVITLADDYTGLTKRDVELAQQITTRRGPCRETEASRGQCHLVHEGRD